MLFKRLSKSPLVLALGSLVLAVALRILLLGFFCNTSISKDNGSDMGSIPFHWIARASLATFLKSLYTLG
jgi:hypothetical protein